MNRARIHRLLDELLDEIAKGANDDGAPPKPEESKPRQIARPDAEIDEVTRKKARSILRQRGFSIR